MKILFVSHSRSWSGAERCLYYLVKGIDRSRFQPVVAIPVPDGGGDRELSDRVEALGVPVVEVGLEQWVRYSENPVHLAESYGLFRDGLRERVGVLTDLIRREKIDLVHTNTCVITEGALAARLCGVPHVWHIHEMLGANPDLFPFIDLETFFSLVTRLSTRIVAVSESVRAVIDRHVRTGLVEVIYNGINIHDVSTMAGDEHEPLPAALADRNGPVVICVGLLSRTKGIMTLVDAVPLVLEAYPAARFLLVGTSSEGVRTEIEERLRPLGAEHAVEFAGFRRNPIRLIAAADMLVLPSLVDSLPVVVMEAMAVGKPVVATRSGGAEEMIVEGGTGRLVPRQDPAALAQAVISLLDNPEAALAMGREGRKRAESLYSEEQYLRSFERVFDEAVEAGTVSAESGASDEPQQLERFLTSFLSIVDENTTAALVAQAGAQLVTVTALAREREAHQAQEVSRRDAIIVGLQASLREQTAWAQAAAADVSQRDQIITELQRAVREQSEWAQHNAAEIARRDAIVVELQASLSEQTRWAQDSAARPTENESLIRELNGGRLEESRRSFVEAARRDANHFERLQQEHERQTIELRAHLDALQLRMDELLALGRRSFLGRLRSVVDSGRSALEHALDHLKHVLRSGPRIAILHPSWIEVGRPFNPGRDGRAYIAVEGSGFGTAAIVFIAGRALETHRVSDRLLSAHVPDELFARPCALSVWIDNRDGSRRPSPIRSLRVMSKRTVAAYRPASGRWRRLRDTFNWFVWMTSAVSSRIQIPLSYLQRSWATGRTSSPVNRAAPPRPEVPVLAREVVQAHIKPTLLPRLPDVVCFSIIDWDFRYQRPQQILGRLAESGHRVFYLSQRFLDPGDESFRLRPVAPGVIEVFLRSPSALNIYSDALQGDTEETLYSALLDFKAAVGLGETICFVHLPFWTALVLRLKTDLGYRVVFDCLDDFSGFQNIGSGMHDLEATLAAHADLVTASSRMLAEKHASHEPLLVPNAVDYDHFSAAKAPARRRQRTGPTLGYYGAISHWFDADLVARAAAARPDWQFVLIGRTDQDVQAQLGDVPNIRLLAEVPYEELPAHLAIFDVCLIPFVVDDLIRAANPVKFFEYLAAGKPVVAARMPELVPFSGQCFLYEGLPEFLRQVHRALASKDDPVLAAVRRVVAKANTWDMRVDVLRRALERLYPRVSVIVVTYDGLDLTRACVDSLMEKTAYADWELIVVDNNSSDGTPAYLRSLSKRHPFVQIVLNGSNRGFAAANNQGVRVATGEFIVLLNNDTVVTQGWLGKLVRHLDDPGVGMVGPVTNTIGNEAQIAIDYGDLSDMEAFAGRYTRDHVGRVFDIPVLAMFCVAMRRSLVDKVGMLDERYEVGMFEDDDFSRSVKALGYRVVCAEDVFIHHVGGASFRRLDPETYQRIFDSNRRRYEEKWGEPWIPHRYRQPEEVRDSARGPDDEFEAV